MEGFCSLELNPLGPVQLYAAPGIAVVATFAIIESYELRLQLSIPLLRDDKGHPAAWFQALNVPKVRRHWVWC